MGYSHFPHAFVSDLAAWLCTDPGIGTTPVASSAESAEITDDPMGIDPVAALNHLRLLEYENKVEEVLARLATPRPANLS